MYNSAASIYSQIINSWYIKFNSDTNPLLLALACGRYCSFLNVLEKVKVNQQNW